MKIRKIFLVIGLLAVYATSFATEPELNRIPKRSHKDLSTVSYRDNNTGWWWSGEFSTGYSVRFGKPIRNNVAFAELDFTTGYRFSEYFRVGPGVGLRYYFPAHKLRLKDYPLSVPIYLNIRGQFESSVYRRVVPYYSLDVGTSITDGLMIRPTIGLRFGALRGSFLIGVSYLGQTMKTYEKPDSENFISFACVRLGYEF